MAHVEREIKLGAPAAFGLPDLTGVVDGAVVRPVAAQELDATYFDTADVRLARSGITVRNRIDRTDDASEWTVKFPAGGDGSSGAVLSRHEIDVVAPPGAVPDTLLALLAGRVRTAPIAPIARLVTHRRRLFVDVGAAAVAEVADDTVTVLAGDGTVLDEFREIEVEIVGGAGTDAGEPLLAAVAERLQQAGAREPDTVPKLVRALGERACAEPELATHRPGKRATAADGLRAALAASVRRVIEHHHVIHLDADPEGVHQSRVGLRRLRSDLRTFRPLIDAAWGDALRDELRWLADALGRVRDADVLLARLGDAVERLPDDDRAPGRALVERAAHERAAAQHDLVGVLATPRYVALLDRLVDAATAPRLLPETDARAADVLPRLAAKAWRRLRKAVRALDGSPTDAELHRVRIRAKQARYAADVAAPVVGAGARSHSAAIADLQDVLGDLHDAAVAETWLRSAGRASRGGRAVAAGLLVADQRGEAAAGRQAWPRAWKAARRKKHTRWLTRS